MGSDMVREARRRAENYRKAIQFLEGLENFTYEDLKKSLKIAETKMTESETLQLWNTTKMMLGGPEDLRKVNIDSLRKGLKMFEEIAGTFGR